METADIEKRLAAVERAVERLTREGNSFHSHPVEAIEKIHGVFEDDAATREAMRLGRQWRKAQRPSTRKPRAKRT